MKSAIFLFLFVAFTVTSSAPAPEPTSEAGSKDEGAIVQAVSLPADHVKQEESKQEASGDATADSTHSAKAREEARVLQDLMETEKEKNEGEEASGDEDKTEDEAKEEENVVEGKDKPTTSEDHRMHLKKFPFFKSRSHFSSMHGRRLRVKRSLDSQYIRYLLNKAVEEDEEEAEREALNYEAEKLMEEYEPEPPVPNDYAFINYHGIPGIFVPLNDNQQPVEPPQLPQKRQDLLSLNPGIRKREYNDYDDFENGQDWYKQLMYLASRLADRDDEQNAWEKALEEDYDYEEKK